MNKSFIGSSAVIFGLAVAIAGPSLEGCGSSGGASPNASKEGALGTIQAALTLPGGETLTGVTWTVNSGTTVIMSSTAAVPASATTITFPITNVPAGDGYTLTLSAASPDGAVSCLGTSAAFDVATEQTVDVNVFLLCNNTADGGVNAGGVVVSGSTVNCGTWTSASATPSSAAVGGTVALAAGAVGPQTSALTFSWSATAGTIATGTPTALGQSLATFTCPATPGVVTISLSVGDGPVPSGAECPAGASSTTLTVVCGNPPCQGVGTGVEATPNSTAGVCPAGSINSGTLTDGAGNFCCSAAPCTGVGTGVEATPDTATGACPTGSVNSGTLTDGAGNFCCSTAVVANLVPCTTAGQTGCVSCQGSSGGVCTPTEAAIVQYDISVNKTAVAVGPDPATGCYSCLYNAGGLDDVTFGDTGHECGDLSAGGQAACLTTLNCILGSSCAATAVSTCYCGSAPTSGTCTSGGANGSCDAQEAAGLGFAETDGLDILENFTSTTLPSGVANNILQAAISNNCKQCL